MKNSGRFKPGVSGNPNGRPRGSRNRNSLREKVETLLDANFDQIQGWIEEMEPKDRATFLLRLLEYSLPKLRSTEFISEFDNLSDEDLYEIINRLTSNSYEQQN